MVGIYDLQISNGIGAISGLVQLILYACYCSCKGTENNDDDDVHTPKPITAFESLWWAKLSHFIQFRFFNDSTNI